MNKKQCPKCNKLYTGRTLKGACESCYKQKYRQPHKNINLICKTCKQEFTTTEGQKDRKKFCSKKCKIKQEAAKRAEYQKQWAPLNRNKVRSISAKAYKKAKTNYRFRVKTNLISRLRFRKSKNNKLSTTKIVMQNLGCTINELITYLELKFQPEMSWDNYGKFGWHIDHIVPLASFNLEDPEELKKACHYTNLQPLWAKDNLSKGDKYPINRGGL
jgi:hypothetical protein